MSDSPSNNSPETAQRLGGKNLGFPPRESQKERPLAPELTCHDFENRVQDLLDSRCGTESDPEIRFHAERCPKCRLLLGQFQQLESVLSRALFARHHEHPEVAKPTGSASTARKSTRSPSRPLHPVSRSRRANFDLAARAAVVLLLAGFIAFQIGFAMKRQNVLLPVAGAGGAMFAAGSEADGSGSGIRPVAHYRSLEQCYELTIELPGVRSLQTSILVALDWCRDYFKLDGGQTPEPPHHERGFGLNPLRAEINRQA